MNDKILCCIDCITFPICKSCISEKYQDTKADLYSEIYRYHLLIYTISDKCSIFQRYMGTLQREVYDKLGGFINIPNSSHTKYITILNRQLLNTFITKEYNE